jgi:hypothetical protein
MRDLSFEMLSPAVVNLPDGNASCLVLNCAYLPGYVVDSANLITLLPPGDLKFTDSLIINRIFDGLFVTLGESPFPGLRDAGYLEIRTSDTTGFLRSLSPSTVSAICADHGTDYLISLEYYSYNQDHEYYYTPEEDYYQLFVMHAMKLYWRIYSDSGRIIDEHEQRDTIFGEEPDYEYPVSKSIPLNPDLIADAFWQSGLNYGRRISPFWENVNRSIYELYDKRDSGRVNISQKKSELEILSTSRKKTKAFKACYNLAVLSESNGNIKEALEWINKALRIESNITALKYSAILRDRQKEMLILDRQTGIKAD